MPTTTDPTTSEPDGKPSGKLETGNTPGDHGDRAFSSAETYGAYLSSDGRSVQTWPGGTLARVIYSTTRRNGGFCRGERTYFHAVAPDGSRWYGSSPGPGMYARLHRSRDARRRV